MAHRPPAAARGLAAGAASGDDPSPLHPRALACLLALVAIAPTAAQVDTAKRNEAFEPRPVAQEHVERTSFGAGPSQPAAVSQRESVTVPADDAQIRLPQTRAKKKAPIDMTARSMPVLEAATARISTAQPAPAKFEKKFATPTVARIQDGMTEAGRVKATTVKAKGKDSILDRINRFVFRRNPAEPEPAIEPAGGADPPVAGAAVPAESSGP